MMAALLPRARSEHRAPFHQICQLANMSSSCGGQSSTNVTVSCWQQYRDDLEKKNATQMAAISYTLCHSMEIPRLFSLLPWMSSCSVSSGYVR